MTEDDADIVIDTMAAGFRVEIDEDQRRVWRNVLASTAADVGVEAADRMVVEQMWFPKPVEFGEYVRKVQHERAESAQELAAVVPLPSSQPHCDGSRWIKTDDGSVPCPRCYPSMREVFEDNRRWQRWRTGTPAEKLVSPEWKNVPSPPACVTTRYDEYEAADPTFARGANHAADEYEAEHGRPAPEWLRRGRVDELIRRPPSVDEEF